MSAKSQEPANIPDPKSIRIPGFNLKSVKHGKSEDGGSLYAKICIGSKPIAQYEDSGRGEPSVLLFVDKDAEQQIKNLIAQHKIREQLFIDEYSFYDSIDDLKDHDAIDWLVNSEYEALMLVNTFKKLLRKCDESFVVASDSGDAKIMVWPSKSRKRYPLAEMVKFKGALELLQRDYNKLVASMTNGEFFLNSAEQLKALGLQVSPEKHKNPIA